MFNIPRLISRQVFGIPDERFGEVICAWVVLRPDRVLKQVDLYRFCQGKVSNYKIPTYFRIVDGFPKSESGKIEKQVMVDEMVNIIKEGVRVEPVNI